MVVFLAVLPSARDRLESWGFEKISRGNRSNNEELDTNI